MSEFWFGWICGTIFIGVLTLFLNYFETGGRK